MKSAIPYNAIAGQSLERLAALSDGVFAFAMTLLVLELRVPPGVAHTDRELGMALVGLLPRMGTYLMSFLTLGIFWAGQQAQMSHLIRADRHLSWIYFGFLSVVSLMPFSTSLLSEYLSLRLALLVYWFNLFMLGFVIYLCWRYARKAGLVKAETTEAIQCALVRRIFVGQGLYAFGAALCFFSTTLSIVFIVSVQLNFAIAPRIRWLSEF